MVLALVLVGYKCVREASTEVYLSEAIEMVNCTIPLLKRISDDEAALEDSILPLREMFETCLRVVAALTKYGIEEFHLQEVKSLNQRKLIQAKLAFSLEQIIVVAKLALESKYAEDCEANKSICVIALRYCIRCFQTVFSDSNMQVQVIGLQFLKARIQRGVNTEDNSFLMFLAGELITDIFTLIHKMLKKNITRESVNIASECLSLMVVLQTLAKGNDCQRSFMTLLLEAIVTIFLSTTDGFSPEIRDLRSTAIKLVSRLAQIPSSAMHFKDVLLSMPPLHRQELQGVIRASVTNDKNQTEQKVPVLDIKMPKPAVRNEEKHPTPSAAVMQSDENNEEEDEFSEEDWDAFQSFPVSKNEGGDESKTEHSDKEKDPSMVESSSDLEGSTGDVEFQESAISKSISSEKEMKSDESVEAFKEKHDQTDPGAEPRDNEHQKMEEKLQSSRFQEEASSISGNELESCEDMLEQIVSDSLALQQGVSESDNEHGNRGEEDAKKDDVDENESRDFKQGMSESPVEREHQEMEEELRSSGLQGEASAIPVNDLVLFDQKPKVEAEGSSKEDMPEQLVSNSPEPQQVVSELDENESRDPKQGTSESPVESKHQEMEEELQSSQLQEEALAIPQNELEVEAEGSIEEDVPEQVVSDSPKLQQGVLESDNIEHSNRRDEDGKNENESHDSNQRTSESPVGSKHKEMEEESQNSELQEEASSIPTVELDHCDQKPGVESEGSVKEDMPEQVVSDSPELQRGVSESDNNDQCNRSDEDAKKDLASENESHDSQQGMSENPVEKEQNSTKE